MLCVRLIDCLLKNSVCVVCYVICFIFFLFWKNFVVWEFLFLFCENLFKILWKIILKNRFVWLLFFILVFVYGNMYWNICILC